MIEVILKSRDERISLFAIELRSENHKLILRISNENVRVSHFAFEILCYGSNSFVNAHVSEFALDNFQFVQSQTNQCQQISIAVGVGGYMVKHQVQMKAIRNTGYRIN